MKRKTIQALAILMWVLALCFLVGIFFVPNRIASFVVQIVYFVLGVVFGIVGYLLTRKGWGEMADPNFSPKQKIVLGTFFALILVAAAVYWLGFYGIGGQGDLAGVDYRVAHANPQGNVHLDFTVSDTWAVDWSNLTWKDQLSIAYEEGSPANGNQAVNYRLYRKDFFGGYTVTDHRIVLTPGNGVSSRLSGDAPLSTYRILLWRASPELETGDFTIVGGSLDRGW